MVEDEKFSKKTGHVGDASQYSIPMPDVKPMTPFNVPGQNQPDKKSYTPDKTLALKALEKDFREYYTKNIEGRLIGILSKGSETDAKPINEALLGYAKAKVIDPSDIYQLAKITKTSGWNPLSKSIRDKLEEKFSLNAPESEEAKKGEYLKAKEPELTKN